MWSRNDVDSPKSTSLFSTFHIGSLFCFFLVSFISSTYTDRNIPFSLSCYKKAFPIWNFCQTVFQKNFLELLFPQEACKWMTIQISLKRNDWIFHTGPRFRPFVSWWTDPNIWTFLYWNFSTIVGPLPFEFGCKQILRPLLFGPAHPGSFDVKFITFAAVICDADDPYSVNTS